MRAVWQTLPLTPHVTDAGIASAPLPDGAAGRWCAVRLVLPSLKRWWARVELSDPSRGQVVRSVFLGPVRAVQGGMLRETLVHVPPGAGAMTLHAWGASVGGCDLSIHVKSRAGAALRLAWYGRRQIGPCFRGERLGVVGLMRAVLGQAPARGGEAPPYDMWIALCEARLAGPPDAPALDIQPVILGGGGAGAHATLASLEAQSLPALRAPVFIEGYEDWARVTATWIVIMRAGETLATSAFAWFAAAAAQSPDAACILCDCDRMGADGQRGEPLFLPGADPLLLRTGLATAGPCAVRWDGGAAGLQLDGAAARTVLAARAGSALVHVPRILCHIASTVPPVVARPAPVSRDAEFTPTVTALVPSAAQSMHVAACLRRIAEETAYPNLRIEILLSAPGSASPRVLRRLRTVPRLTLRETKLEHFNYAAVNNMGAAAADTELLLLLNDDVAPISPAWLDAMVAHMQDRSVGIVGARLLYGNGMVQHEGIIMGLADLCEHAGRLRDGKNPGPYGIALASRDVSAVTAACMLVRASLYRDLGGMDEGFAIALNDVDFCLRARQAGWRIVYCAESNLRHYESVSLGRHYEGARAALESLEVWRLRERWAAVISADPWYNPQASLEPGREWQPAFPPRSV